MAKIDTAKWEMDTALHLAKKGDTELLVMLLQERLSEQEPEATAFLTSLLDRSRKLPAKPRLGYFDLKGRGRKEWHVHLRVEQEVAEQGRKRLPRGKRDIIVEMWCARLGVEVETYYEWVKRGAQRETEASIHKKLFSE